jgi:hypothetical protein
MSDSDRRLDRSPYADQALEKFLNRLRLEGGLFAIVLADEEGRLAATSAEGCTEQELATLAALSGDLQSRLQRWPSLRPLERFQLLAQSGRRLTATCFTTGDAWLTLLIVGDHPVSEALFERAQAGILRILTTTQAR